MRCNIFVDSYHDCLYTLNILPLEYRRATLDLIYTYKVFIYNGLTDVWFSEFFEYCSSKYNLQRHRLHLKSLVNAKLDCHRNFFPICIVNIWNNLPENIVTLSSLHAFKKRLRNFNLSTGTIATFYI